MIEQKYLKEQYDKGYIYLYGYRTLYQIFYSTNVGYYTLKLKYKNTGIPYTIKGYLMAYDNLYLG